MQHRYFHSRSSSYISNAYSCEYNYPQHELEEGNHFKWNRILSIKLLVAIIFIKSVSMYKVIHNFLSYSYSYVIIYQQL